jgi:hypothetical protein
MENLNNSFFVDYGDVKMAWRQQRNYMRYDLFFEMKSGAAKAFKMRLLELNKYLTYFPIPEGRTNVTGFDEDELVEVIDRAKPTQYQVDLLKQKYVPYADSVDTYIDHLRDLENSNVVAQSINNSEKSNGKEKENTDDEMKDTPDKGMKRPSKSRDKCETCGKFHKGKCWELEKEENTKSGKGKGSKSPSSKQRRKTSQDLSFTTDQVTFLLQAQKAMAKNESKGKGKKHKKPPQSDSDSEDDAAHLMRRMMRKRKKSIRNDSDSNSSDSDYIVCQLDNTRRTRRKLQHAICEVIGDVTAEDNMCTALRVLPLEYACC